MTAADRPGRRPRRLLAVHANGSIRHMERTEIASLFQPGDVVVANDAATLPASLHGIHAPSGGKIEIRLAGWIESGDPTCFVAVAFGDGDYRTRTEDRKSPPPLSPGDRLLLGPLRAVVEGRRDHPRLITLRFLGGRGSVLAGLARHGRPIQYAHVPAPVALWDVWTSLAAEPVAFEPPSAGFAVDWRTLESWRLRGIHVVTLTHAAGISSTGDAELDLRLPFDEPYTIPDATAAAVDGAVIRGGHIIAIGTTVVRALESAASEHGTVVAGTGWARNRIGPETRLRVVDAVLSGMHEPGESHFELLKAFAAEPLLNRAHAAAVTGGYRTHEFGDSMLIEAMPLHGAGAESESRFPEEARER